MRSKDWEYLMCILVGIGVTLLICGITLLIYTQEHSLRNEQYRSYPAPLILVGAFFIAMTALVFPTYKKKRRAESSHGFPPPLPPPPPHCYKSNFKHERMF